MSRRILDKHKILWEKKKIIRYLYTKWYREIKQELSSISGPSVELGAGIGNFSEFMPSSLASDIIYLEWLDIVHNAMALPYKNSSIANFILIDTIHHVSSPIAAIDEMRRCLKKNGRIIIYDVYISMFSYLYYSFLHREDVDLSVDVYGLKGNPKLEDPFVSNQAISTLLFFKDLNKFQKKYPELKIIKKEVKEFLLYPLSGGFEGRQLVPFRLVNLLEWIDSCALKYFGNKIAARCLVVLEKNTNLSS
jgi:SAM-dependent methyltransferase